MARDIEIIRPQGRTVEALPIIQPAGQEYVRQSQQLAGDLAQISDNTFRRVEENAYNDYSNKLAMNIDRIEAENAANPDGYKKAVNEFYKGFSKEVRIPSVRQELDRQFTSYYISGSRRIRGQFENKIDQEGQVSSLQTVDSIGKRLSTIAGDFFSNDPVAVLGAQNAYQDAMEQFRRVSTQRKADGTFLFSPEFIVRKEADMVDTAVGGAIVNLVQGSDDPRAVLAALRDGTFQDMTNVFGYKNPLEALSETARERTIAQAEAAIGERVKMVKGSWGELKAGAKLQMTIDPLQIDIDGAFEKFLSENDKLITPELRQDLNVEYLALKEEYIKETKDYRAAMPYLSGQRNFDGTDESKKAIEKGYDTLKQSGAPMADRARWLTQVNLNTVPQPLANEMEANLQSALMSGDVKLAGDLAETYDIIQTSGPVMIADLDQKLSDKSQLAIMRMRDLVRIGGVGPDAFKDIRRIMDADQTTIDERKKELTELQKNKSYRSIAADALDPDIFTFGPADKDAISGLAAVDYRRIFETKYLATGDKDYAEQAAKKLVKGMYAKTDFSRDGFMRMPPETRYALPNDTDTSWMRADLMEAVAENFPDMPPEDLENIQLVADPRADIHTKYPEYLIIKSDMAGDRFDSLGLVWKPDTEARAHFLKLRAMNKLDNMYMKTEAGLNVGWDYAKFLKDWNKGVFKKDVSAMPVDHVFEVGIINQESGGRQFSPIGRPLTSPKGAIGIAQVMPGTAPEAAKLAGLPFDETRYKTDASYNKALGLAYFKKQVEDFGDMRLGIMAYNAGPEAVNKFIQRFGDPRKGDLSMDEFIDKIPYKETKNYVKKISERLNKNAG